MLVASRFLQGAGEALAAPASLGLIALLFPDPRERMKALGLWGGIAGLGGTSGTVIGGVVVGPRASELIFPVTLAVEHRLSVDDVARSFTVYPSLSGSIAEAARRLHPSPIA